MKFLIIGDSYGIGEWKIVGSKLMEIVPNTGLDYYLSNFGHTIDNFSAGSACNFGQIRNAYWKLKENNEYDYIIWFHTEPCRDIVEHIIDNPQEGIIQYSNFKKIKDYYDAMKYINVCNYKFVQEKIYEEFKIPWIVIGGVGRLEDSIDNYTFAQYKIYSWPEELLSINYKLPRNQMLWHRWKEVFEYFKYNKQQVLDELSLVDNFQKLLQQSRLFPDDGHVIRTEYEKLASRIIDIIL
jgi:hypothetical protein